MQINKITVSIGRKLNMGNYEAKNYSITAEVELEDGETVFDVGNRLKESLEHQLEGWEMETKGISPQMTSVQDIISQKEEESDSLTIEEFKCPECDEVMKKKDEKDYYLCTKHWGYPGMIKREK